MLDPGNFDPRALHVRIVECLSYPQWMTTEQVAAKLGDAHYSVSSIMSKLFLYGSPIERQRVPGKANKFEYRLKVKTKS